MTLLQCEKKLLYSTTQYHRHHKNDRGTPTCNSTRRIYITSQFKWNWNWYSVLSAKRCLVENQINRISHCFRWMLVPRHNATPCTWTSEILWPVELKCWVTGDPRVLLHILRRRWCFFKNLTLFDIFLPSITWSAVEVQVSHIPDSFSVKHSPIKQCLIQHQSIYALLTQHQSIYALLFQLFYHNGWILV